MTTTITGKDLVTLPANFVGEQFNELQRETAVGLQHGIA
jgi:hypothetical protein